MSSEHDITIKDIWLARKRVAPYVSQTLLHKSDKLGNVYIKLENMHETSSFKIRGAANKIIALSEQKLQKGIVTFSTGNHGVAVAYLAQQLNSRAVICISHRVPSNKVRRLEAMEAEVIKVGSSQDEAERYAYKLQETKGLTVIPPFDDREIIAGQGTIGLELLHQLPEIEAAIIPVSGGGLFAGIAKVLKKYNPAIQLIGVSIEKSPVMYESLRQGSVVSLEEEETLADSLLGGIGKDNLYTFRMCQAYMDQFVLLSEQEIAEGMNYLLQEHQLAVEGAAASSIAGLISGKINLKNKTTACIITGRNVAMETIREACQLGSKP